MKKLSVLCIICLSVMALFCVTMQAQATLIATDPLPADTYIYHNGLYWAWASPVASQFWGDNELKTPEFHAGWRYATDQEWASRPIASDFGTVDNTKQAAAYWNTIYTHIDYTNAEEGLVTSLPNNSYWETWYVSDNPTGHPVPLPPSLFLLAPGLLGLAGLRKRFSK
jgi:hypothetical protein